MQAGGPDSGEPGPSSFAWWAIVNELGTAGEAAAHCLVARILNSRIVICHRIGSARRPGPATPSEQEGQHEPGQKPADVRHIGDATCLRYVANGTDTAEELQRNPEPDDYQRRHLNHLLALQYSDSSLWEQQNVRGEHARNRPRRSQVRHVGPDAERQLRERRGKSTEQIEDRELQVAETVFHIVTEDPQVKSSPIGNIRLISSY